MRALAFISTQVVPYNYIGGNYFITMWLNFLCNVVWVNVWDVKTLHAGTSGSIYIYHVPKSNFCRQWQLGNAYIWYWFIAIASWWKVLSVIRQCVVLISTVPMLWNLVWSLARVDQAASCFCKCTETHHQDQVGSLCSTVRAPSWLHACLSILSFSLTSYVFHLHPFLNGITAANSGSSSDPFPIHFTFQ